MKTLFEFILCVWLILMILSFFPVLVGIIIGLGGGCAIVFGTYFLIRAILC